MVNELEQSVKDIFVALMTEAHSDDGAIFNIRFLDDYLPHVDCVVELIGQKDYIPFCFVQLKSTKTGYTKKDNRLKVKFSKESIDGLSLYPAPTYIVGIDEKEKTGYLVSANGEDLGSMASILTDFPINAPNRGFLWNEINDFWYRAKKIKFASKFVESVEE
ncbi:DUF4365 domain-containing protein [Rivularia sp. UHCC 0363]|uniref:DUF4365 domain-containing protein n=1 Tax=Rivularia sp. UHCC 0363 TaxID=3110244 RepID=UPI002B1F9507|nr:DUF4365 domain-containing protein [Rivularia sp. UHCC 0363]MEA5598478.1 DUF4365 domain-containing protein [Rivularia sp. UHCC 0363]